MKSLTAAPSFSSQQQLRSSSALTVRSSTSQQQLLLLKTAFRGQSIRLAAASSHLHVRPLTSRQLRAGMARAAVDTHSLRALFRVLGLAPSASKEEIKKAYRCLALKYHPDVCKGDECSIMFQRVAAAYEAVLDASSRAQEEEDLPDQYVEGLMGVGNEDWEDWEEWMGWEGAGTYDFSPLINSRS